ncbi:Tyrosyl-DNA phosphodiesterase 2 [Seminavis robusta]|uniref:Tyrosyl-DNA phosphodiesterase 2 n=1 Tax=Seminavis robusta TaxID=568900 RepID=A0A9N8EVS7_9STRA|nr:Tyrosyl-DNA phosphodiesterase 2 [Seminavis robusta]|eukprot:Sro2139_g316130.1 Tyrosyl-DNA phosphodiesterase 2 (403) ;mRNA; r:7660-8868
MDKARLESTSASTLQQSKVLHLSVVIVAFLGCLFGLSGMRHRAAAAVNDPKTETGKRDSASMSTPQNGKNSQQQQTRSIQATLVISLLAFAALLLLVFGTNNNSTMSMTATIRKPDPSEERSQSTKPPANDNPAALEQLQSLKIVSMNLAACDPSEEAPSDWNVDTVTKAVQKELLHEDPDILALQECPRRPEEWAATYFEGYQVMGVKSSHAFYVMLLVRNGLDATPVPLSDRIPAVVAKITHANGRAVMVASCHLAPFAGGAGRRRHQVGGLLDAAGKEQPLVIAGDTNMRTEEDAVMEGTDFGLLDAWKLAGADPATQHTWDTRNHMDEEGGYFNKYYGDKTREYATRYDRIYISPPAQADSGMVSVESFGLLANKPVIPSSRTHFLSDHFGMVCELKI